MNFAQNLNETINKLGLVLSSVIVKLLSCFYKAAEGSMLPCALLQGVPGAGKTSTAEAFALAVGATRYFYQCNPGTGMDQLIGQPNLAAVLRQDAAACISDGILIQAAKTAMAGQDVVLILDEIDKCSPETDSYLLDFLQSRRIHDSNMEELVVPSDVKFWVFLTSNNERDLSDALMRRVRRITVDRPSRATVAEVLGIEEKSALLDVWELTEKLAISQLRNYLEDGGDPQNLDIDILGQYVDDLPEINKEETAPSQTMQLPPPLPAVIDVRLDRLNNSQICELGSFGWQKVVADVIHVEAHTLSELWRAQLTFDKGIHELIPYANRDDSDDEHGLLIDNLDPVVENDTAGVFVVTHDGRQCSIVAQRRSDGKFYLNGNDLHQLTSSTLAPPDNYEKVLFAAKHAANMQQRRTEAAVSQATNLISKLGLDDLI